MTRRRQIIPRDHTGLEIITVTVENEEKGHDLNVGPSALEQ